MLSLLRKLRAYLRNVLKKVVFLFLPELDPVFPIKHMVRSIPEAILREGIAEHVAAMTKIRDIGIETYVHTGKASPAFRTEMYFAPRHVYRLNNVSVNVKSGACFTETNGFLESYGSLRKWIQEKPVHRKNGSRFNVDFPVTCIKSASYGHFIMEELPRLLWALKQYPDLRLIRPERLPAYITDTYSELRKNNILRFEPIVLEAENVIVNDFVFTQAKHIPGSGIKTTWNT